MKIASTISFTLICAAALFAQPVADSAIASNPHAQQPQAPANIQGPAPVQQQQQQMQMMPPQQQRPMYAPYGAYQGYPPPQQILQPVAAAPKEPEKPETKYFNGVGLALGLSSSPYGITEFGLSYRHWFEGGSGLQLTLFPYFQKDKNDKYANLSAGASFLKILHPAKRFNLYSFISYSYNYKYESNVEWDPNTSTAVDREDKVHQISFGPGIDFHVKNLSLNLQVGAGSYYESKQVYGMCVNMEGAVFYAF